jgi:hypothetical protein
MKSILDPTFRDTSSANTDLRKTFARVRRELRKQAPTGQNPDQPANVASIFRRQRRAVS